MLRKFFSIVAVTMVLSACGGAESETASSAEETNQAQEAMVYYKSTYIGCDWSYDWINYVIVPYLCPYWGGYVRTLGACKSDGTRYLGVACYNY